MFAGTKMMVVNKTSSKRLFSRVSCAKDDVLDDVLMVGCFCALRLDYLV